MIGTGYCGLAAAAKLKTVGVKKLTILERSGEVGGVWRENRYAGSACDTPSHLYSLSFFKNPFWRHKFACQKDIMDYLKEVSRVVLDRVVASCCC